MIIAAARLISPWPGRNARIEPLSSESARSAAAATAASIRSPGFRPIYLVTIGKARPSLRMTGASSRSAATRAPSSVADMTRMRKSSRSADAASRQSASERSASRERSWNSSKMTSPTSASAGSPRIIRAKTPSVTISMRVLLETCVCERTLSPMVSPTRSPSVEAMRSAAARAAMRRGSSMMIFWARSQGSLRRTSGTRVVLPAPGGATRTAFGRAARWARSSSRTMSMGSASGLGMAVLIAVWRAADKSVAIAAQHWSMRGASSAS
ncbi:conserved protein of unknown function [Methylocella tundrae]|uniref:Uncharacterized protein n=1 Tax=Methylocella tundrae TaxID=227605 RepID=A0A4U8Z2G9_METTU|nr:conserved protein of unknown function [Methylocella tundrae]